MGRTTHSLIRKNTPLQLDTTCPWRRLLPGPGHQQLDLMASDAQTAPQHELGVHPVVVEGTAGFGVDAPDRLGQQRMADLPGAE